MDNLNIMVEAKKEYMGQLYLIMCPPMIEVFQDMYNEATKLSSGTKDAHYVSKVVEGSAQLVERHV
jgi:hypothetical protein